MYTILEMIYKRNYINKIKIWTKNLVRWISLNVLSTPKEVAASYFAKKSALTHLGWRAINV